MSRAHKHWWVIGETGPDGMAPARCKRCRARREFNTRPVDSWELLKIGAGGLPPRRQRGADQVLAEEQA